MDARASLVGTTDEHGSDLKVEPAAECIRIRPTILPVCVNERRIELIWIVSVANCIEYRCLAKNLVAKLGHNLQAYDCPSQVLAL